MVDSRMYQDHEIEIRQVQIPAELHASRLDKALVSIAPEFSRSYLQQLLSDGEVSIDGAVALKASLKVRLGQTLSVRLCPSAHTQALSQIFQPESLPLSVLYEDEHLLVLNKPAGLVVHPAAGNWQGTLLNRLLAWHAGAAQLPRAGIVQRLDKDTSGIMVVAKQRRAMDALVEQLAQRRVLRRYVALGQGAWRGGKLSVEEPIGRDPRNRLRMAVVAGESGKPARTDFVCLASNAQNCLVQAQLHTGRTHQIRVHMRFLGHPLVGDETYGGRATHQIKRQALHALTLGLEHPITQEYMEWQAEPPSDFLVAVQEAGFSDELNSVRNLLY